MPAGNGIVCESSSSAPTIFLAGVKPLEEMYRARNQSVQFHIRAAGGKLTLDVLKATLRLRKSQVKRFVAQPNGKKGEDAVDTLISQISSNQVATFSQKLEALPFVRHVESARRTVTSRRDQIVSD
jgi:putative Mg2+ transporter-C (MgtC) family protein